MIMPKNRIGYQDSRTLPERLPNTARTQPESNKKNKNNKNEKKKKNNTIPNAQYTIVMPKDHIGYQYTQTQTKRFPNAAQIK